MFSKPFDFQKSLVSLFERPSGTDSGPKPRFDCICFFFPKYGNASTFALSGSFCLFPLPRGRSYRYSSDKSKPVVHPAATITFSFFLFFSFGSWPLSAKHKMKAVHGGGVAILYLAVSFHSISCPSTASSSSSSVKSWGGGGPSSSSPKMKRILSAGETTERERRNSDRHPYLWRADLTRCGVRGSVWGISHGNTRWLRRYAAAIRTVGGGCHESETERS